MKDIREYAKLAINRDSFLERNCCRRSKFNEWKRMYEDFVGETVEDTNQELYDFTLESLKSHDTSKLIKAINKKYPNIELGKFNEKTKDKFILMCNDGDEIDKLKNDKNLLDFFNYFVAYDFNNEDERVFVLEPTYPEDASRLVEDAHLRLYHICSKSLTNRILQKGLRCRGMELSDDTYSAFPSRIYCLAIPYKKGSDKFNEELNEFLKESEFSKTYSDLL